MALIKNLPEFEKPREKAMHFGFQSMSNAELLALFIRIGTKGKSAVEVAQDLLKSCGGLSNLSSANISQLLKVKGISKTKAIEIQAIFELMRRASFEEVIGKDVLCNLEAVIQWLKREIGSERVEKFLVIFLDVRKQVITYKIIGNGTIHKVDVCIRDIYKEALIQNASSILLVHNHPSGNLIPSLEDIEFTKEVKKGAKLLDIEVIDHLIVSSYSVYSMENETYQYS